MTLPEASAVAGESIGMGLLSLGLAIMTGMIFHGRK